MQEQGKSASTIKTDLSAIRFFHDKMSHPRYTLPDNGALGVALERRRFGQQDRTWTNPEFGKLIGRAMAEEREDYILALYLARYAGLRIHECFRMDTAAAERALRENALTVKGKGGKVRIVPIEDDRITTMLERLLEKTERGHKLLVPDGIPTDRAINGMQQFILRHRDAICDPTVPGRRITVHGLRHTYAAEKYTSLVDGGMTPLDAHFTVSHLLGHERPDVTDIYLASVKGGTARGEYPLISVPPLEIPGKNNICVNLYEIPPRLLTIRITADKKREKPQIAVASPVLIVSFRVCLLILSAISVDAVPVANYGIRFLHDPADGFVQQLEVVDVHGAVHIHVGQAGKHLGIIFVGALNAAAGQIRIEALYIVDVRRTEAAVYIAILNEMNPRIEQRRITCSRIGFHVFPLRLPIQIIHIGQTTAAVEGASTDFRHRTGQGHRRDFAAIVQRILRNFRDPLLIHHCGQSTSGISG